MSSMEEIMDHLNIYQCNIGKYTIKTLFKLLKDHVDFLNLDAFMGKVKPVKLKKFNH